MGLVAALFVLLLLVTSVRRAECSDEGFGGITKQGATAPMPPDSIGLRSLAISNRGKIAVVGLGRDGRAHLWVCTNPRSDQDKRVLEPDQAWEPLCDERANHEDLKVSWCDEKTLLVLRCTGNRQDAHLVSSLFVQERPLTRTGDITDCTAGDGELVIAQNGGSRGGTIMSAGGLDGHFRAWLTRPGPVHSLGLYGERRGARGIVSRLYWAEDHDGGKGSAIMASELDASGCQQAVPGTRSVSALHPVLLDEDGGIRWMDLRGRMETWGPQRRGLMEWALSPWTWGGKARALVAEAALVGISCDQLAIVGWDRRRGRIRTLE